MNMLNAIVPDSLFRLINHELRMTGGDVMEGWVTAERGLEMAEIILQNKPNTCVQIGTFGGRSLIAQALALREIGHGKIYAIDPWKKEACLEGENVENQKWWAKVDMHDIHRKAMECVWKHGLDEYVVVIRNASHHVPHLFAGGIDVLEIDGNHSEVASCRDVELYAPMLNPGAYVHFDDSDWPTTHKALSLLEQTCELLKDGRTYRIYRRKHDH